MSTPASAQTAATDATPKSSSPLPSISLPKGGGAVRGIGEKFEANAISGTGSMTIPIVTSPGRSGSGPQLSLSYDSGNGNGPFGIGWHLSMPTITRKTDKGLPLYQDANETDVFILSGAEDLVPLYKRDQNGALIHDAMGKPVYDETARDGYTVRRYSPRVEGTFSRIERWTRQSDGDVHWRSITRDNNTVLYGKDSESRIFSPPDSETNHLDRVFSWLLCESYDSKGNAIVYSYKEEDSVGVPPSYSHERNRTDQSRSANRYLKSIKYGNRKPNRDDAWATTDPAKLPAETWMFKVVFDYGEHDLDNPSPDDQKPWICRDDPFSSYRAGFEVRTYRLCRRVLMFHCFPDELGVENYLVHSMDFNYSQDPVASFITSLSQSGYVRQPDSSQANPYLKKSLPPLEFEYSKVPDSTQLPLQTVDPSSLENLPYGVDGVYSWVDLDGEGLTGIFTAQAESWFYKRNLSASNQVDDNGTERTVARFGPIESLSVRPGPIAGQPQFMDLAGDGQLDVVQMEAPNHGFYKRIDDSHWLSFRAFVSRPNVDTHDPNLRFVDLNGDGHADILITENEVFTWYPSLAEDGFGPAQRVSQPVDEEKGPRLIFADGTQSIYLADFSGDGLSDLARIRNGDICYWPNLGYGCFGSRVNMDNAPWFDYSDQFDHQRIRLADIDGSGPTDILYLGHHVVDIYRNQSGNSWSQADRLAGVPPIDQLSTATAIDLLGNGTVCLVWSSSSPGDARQSMHYVDLMGGQKPHLLVRTVNNLGAETRIQYAPSTYFYLLDKQAGKPWVTHVPFPVHCVQRVETYDHVSHNYFSTRYAYHHGYFDGVEREFNGFGMVEQWDTEEFGTLSANPSFPDRVNVHESSNAPPVHTKTWFHTGVYLGDEKISRHLAHEYYGSDALDDQQFNEFLKTLLDDTVLPATPLTASEMREACRSLKGSMLRQEIYADDGGPKAGIPYSISERNYMVELLQSLGSNLHSIFFTHPRENLSYHCERNPMDSRVQHEQVLEVDHFGNVLRSVRVGYGRQPGRSPLPGDDRTKQEQLLIMYTENDVTNAVDAPDDYCTPLPCETRTYQISGFALTNGAAHFSPVTFSADNFAPINALNEIPYGQENNPALPQKRLIKRTRTLYRSDDLTRLLPIGQLEATILPGENYKLAFTNGLLQSVFQRKHDNQPTENLLPNPAGVLGGQGDNQGGYIDLDGDGSWWIPSGRVFFHPESNTPYPQELAEARTHFFLLRRFTDPFGHSDIVEYDPHLLLPTRTRDALDNTVDSVYDYRVLGPVVVTDPNGNRSEVVHDVLGRVVGTAVMGKATEGLGDSLTNFRSDLTQEEIDLFFAQPGESQRIETLLGTATTRIIYDVTRYWLEPDLDKKRPVFSAVLTRETHTNDPLPPDGLKIQVNFSYSDGFGREIQKKIQAEPGLVDGGSVAVNPRWVGSGWTIFNNKGKPVRQYEPFFDDTHDFKFDRKIGVSPVLMYDPMERVVATLHPNHSWEKVVFDPWQQKTYDVNDTVLQTDPKTDPDVGHLFQRLPDADYLPTWYDSRKTGQQGPDQQSAAQKTAVHFDTPTVTHFDVLGRVFLTIADNGAGGSYANHVLLDVEGNDRKIVDAKDRVVMLYDYDMLGTRIHQSSMEAGERWMLNNSLGLNLLSWNSRGFRLRSVYDPLHRHVMSYLQENTGPELLVERIVYGEAQTSPEIHNLRGKIVQIFDQAGVVTEDDYDFKGNLLRSQRQLAQEYKTTLDWSTPIPLEVQIYTNLSRYDALNRITELTAPDNSIIRLIYNEANFLEQVQVNLRGEQMNMQPIWTPFVTDINYDAKGRRTLIQYNNGTRTNYEYDPLDSQLIHLQTQRNGGLLQDLHYTRDPVGNITYIRDDAQQTVFFRNRRVEPSADYTYDAIYRLIQATGREHLGLMAGGKANPPTAPDAFNNFHTRLDHPGNGNAMGTYVEKYLYDAVNNILAMTHSGSDPVHPGWTRTYNYNEISQVEASKTSNRLSSTKVGGSMENYSYDGNPGLHGMMKMPNLSLMRWDYKDQLQATAQQVVNDGMPETTWYTYDGSGQRVRKITDRYSAGQMQTRMKERIYLGIFEIYREYGNDGSTISLERETLHVMDDKQPVALVETRTQGNDNSPQQLIRFQYGNHLGTACLELDDQAQIITYEEYYPFGSTSYQAVRSQTETPKRYRYTGKERDEESGLYYHGARYYACWLGKWTSPDPLGLIDGVNLYQYSRSNPLSYHDPSGTIPKVEPIQAGVGFLGDYEGLSTRWKNAVQTVLEAKHGGGSYENNLRLFKDAIAKLPPGSNRQKGTGINVARRTYSQVRTLFGKMLAAEGIPLPPGTQLHHFKPGLAKNPTEALNASGLIVASGNAGDPASLHGKIHALEEAAKGGSEAGSDLAKAESTVGQATKLESAVGNVAKAESVTQELASAGAGLVKAESTLAKASSVGKVLKSLAPAAKVLGKIATPLGLLAGGAQIATATNRLDRVSAVADMAAGAAAFAGPVGEAFSAGYTAGGLVDKGIEYASQKAFGVDLSPSNGIATVLTATDKLVSKAWADPSKPAYTQTVGWKLADWLGL